MGGKEEVDAKQTLNAADAALHAGLSPRLGQLPPPYQSVDRRTPRRQRPGESLEPSLRLDQALVGPSEQRRQD